MGPFALLSVLTLQTAPTIDDLGWLAGYWLTCEDGREVSETWSDPRGGVMSGMTVTLGASGRGGVEFARIAPQADGGLAFFALPDGQPPATFALTDADAGRAVFSNPAHDFPQRVSYRRDGDALTARIEGTNAGREMSMEWHYRSAPLNARCPT